MAEGNSISVIARKLSVEYCVAEKTIIRLIDEVMAEWESQSQIDTQLKRAMAVARHNEMYRKAIEGGAIKTANDIQKEINKLHGLYDSEADAPTMPKFIKVKEADQGLTVIPGDKSKVENE